MLKSYRPTGNKIHIETSDSIVHELLSSRINFFQSGTASLAAAITASCKLKGLTSNCSEILLPAYACPDLVSAILFAGAKPVLVDLQENSTFLSLTNLETKINKNTVAIIAVNFLGIVDQIDKIKKICDRHQLTFINDSAQYFPKSSDISDWPGDFSIISFGRGKPVNLLHGGAVISSNKEKQNALESIKLSPSKDCSVLSATLKILLYNLAIQPIFYGALTHLPGLKIGETRYNELAAILKMDRFYLSLLNRNIEHYIDHDTKQNLIRQKMLEINNPEIIDLSSITPNSNISSLLRYPLLITNKAKRNRFVDETSNLGVSVMYKRPLPQIKGLESLFSPQEKYPNATDFADYLVTLPTHEDVTASQINQIFDELSLM